jgi:hypothetical protein
LCGVQEKLSPKARNLQRDFTVYNATCGGRDRCRAGSVIFKRRK